MKERLIEDWLRRRIQPVTVAEIAAKFKCSKSTAYTVAMRLWHNDQVNVCHLGRARHFSRKLS